jgi:hypothetical protein
MPSALKRLLPVVATLIFLLLLPSAPLKHVFLLDSAQYHIINSSEGSGLGHTGRRLLYTEDFDLACLETYFIRGQPCHRDLQPPIEVVWTWVNGSDPRFDATKQELENKVAVAGKPSRPPQGLSEQRMYR